MELAFFVYLASVVENIAAFAVVFGSIVCVIVGVHTMATGMDNDSYSVRHKHEPKKQQFFKLKVVMLLISVLSFITAALIPKEKQMYMIAAAYMTQSVAQSDMGKDIYKIIKLKTEGYIAELEEKAKK